MCSFGPYKRLLALLGRAQLLGYLRDVFGGEALGLADLQAPTVLVGHALAAHGRQSTERPAHGSRGRHVLV